MRRREKKSDCTGSESGERGQVPRYLGDGDGGMGCALGGPGMERPVVYLLLAAPGGYPLYCAVTSMEALYKSSPIWR